MSLGEVLFIKGFYKIILQFDWGKIYSDIKINKIIYNETIECTSKNIVWWNND